MRPLLVASLLLLQLLQTNHLATGQSCSGSCVRREFRTLSDAERQTYISGILALKANGVYETMVNQHSSAGRYAHSTGRFLVWHRAFMYEFEQALQSVAPGACAHYWSWDVDSQAPAQSPIWQWMGTTSNGCLSNGPFAGWQGERGCVSRGFDGGDTMSAFYSMELINQIITSSTSYATFCRAFESGPHAAVHNGIGGTMATLASPDDPVFFLHHSFIDKVYLQWQLARPEIGNTYGGTGQGGEELSATEQMSPWFSHTPQSLLSVANLCYSYADFGGGAAASTATAASVSSRLLRRQDSQVHAAFYDSNGRVSNNVSGSGTGSPAPKGAVLDSQEVSRPAAGAATGGAAGGGGGGGGGVVVALNETAPNFAAMPFTPAQVSFNLTTLQTPLPATPALGAAAQIPEPDFSAIPVKVSPPKDKKSSCVYEIKGDASFVSDKDNMYGYNGHSNLLGLRRPRPIPDDFLRMMFFTDADIAEHRERERRYFDTYDRLNGLHGYVSPASLYHRRDLMAGIIRRRLTDHFDADVHGVARVVIGVDYDEDPEVMARKVCYTFDHFVDDYVVQPARVRAQLTTMVGKNTAGSDSASNFMNPVSVPKESSASAMTRTGVLSLAAGLLLAHALAALV